VSVILEHMTCMKCPGVAEQVIHAATNTRVGWYCSSCKAFEPAIGRERLVSEPPLVTRETVKLARLNG